MKQAAVSEELQTAVRTMVSRGDSHRKVAKALGVSLSTVSKYASAATFLPKTDKKRGDVNWRELNRWIASGQQLKSKASFSQDEARIELGDGKSPIILGTLSDMHIGAIGSDHEALERFTDEALSIPNFYFVLLGDYIECAIKLRSAFEVMGQILTAEMQHDYFEAWLNEVADKIAWSTWDNHAVERQEKLAGESSIRRLLSRRVVYHNGIGHADVVVGKQTYKVASSHRFRGSSFLNPCHAAMRYMRMEAQDRDICMMGDTHVPGMFKYADGHKVRIAINTGTLHVNSGYAKRYFSIKTHPVFPCVVLRHDEHMATPYWSIAEALAATK